MALGSLYYGLLVISIHVMHALMSQFNCYTYHKMIGVCHRIVDF